MTFRTLLVSVFALGLLMSSCKKKSDVSPEEELPLGTLQFKADGQEHVFSGVLGIIAIDSLVSNEKTFWIQAFDLTQSSEFKIVFDFTNVPLPQEGNTYETVGTDCQPVPIVTEICPLLTWTPGLTSTHQYSTFLEGAQATVTFSKLDTSENGVAKGSFSATLVDPDDATAAVKITEGLFNVSVH